MKCICGHDFDGNFCPYCGRSVGNMQNQTNNISNINLNNSSDSEEKESGSKILREAYHESKMARLNWNVSCCCYSFSNGTYPVGYYICDSGNIGNALVDKKGRIKESFIDYRQCHIGVAWYFYLVLG